jgi:NADH:ubiquinone reductase (H+-translocating)
MGATIALGGDMTTVQTPVTPARPHVVILGGGFGGLAAALALKHAPVHVTLIDRNNHQVFQPLLYQVATSGLEMSDVGFALRTVLRRHANVDVLMAEVESIDPSSRTVDLTDGNTLTYDYLVVATGARVDYLGHPEWKAYAPGLKDLADAMAIRSRVLSAFERAEEEHDPGAQRAYLTFVVVGGGPTGVELAGAIAELAKHSLRGDFRHIDPASAKVLLIDAGHAILPAYPEALQRKALDQLESLGVEVRLNCSVEDVDQDGVRVDGKRIAARCVLWAAGVRGTPIASSLGTAVDRHGRIPVTPTLRAPGLPNVFVIGDLAALDQDGKAVPGVAAAAMQEGRFAARAIAADVAGKTVKPFRYVNRGELATIGRSKAVGALPSGLKLSGFFAWITYATVHLYYLLGAVNRVRVFSSWVWSFLTYGRRARLIPRAWTEAKAHAPTRVRTSATAPVADHAPPAQLHQAAVALHE